MDKELNKIILAAKSNEEKQLFASMDLFERNTEVTPILYNKDNEIIYMPGINTQVTGPLIRYQITMTREEGGEMRSQINKALSFQKRDLILSYSPKVRTIADTTQVFMKFFPYFLSFVILLSACISYLFSKKMVTPLQEMNKIALDMVNLNFKNQIKIDTKDEIGQLANNLNNLGVALENALVELKKQNQSLSFQLERERENDQLRESFMMAISHELKSPIAASMGLLEAMQYNITPYDNHDKYLQETYNILENMSLLVQDMLNVSFLDQVIHSQDDEINLNQELRDLVSHIQRNPDFRDREVYLSLDSIILVQSSEVLVKKILQNLLSNAFLYSGKGGQIKIVTKKLDKNRWYCSIFNTSSAIQEHEFSRLFEPFYRLEKSGNKQTGGNGLGLFLIKRFLTLLKLDYEFQNTNGGVIFSIYSKSDSIKNEN
ncbi:HAMP domain-containing sensor histidine kinase [Lactococcus petauri]|uniref:HAMP domain-containing sensor histidine kinase n=1 Tax=Lactococcus petauri TaxID=1940789 RepID=UPI0018A89BCD|nr:HAMP domain-containing sensor histidine kinase [Lactococcus petauri]MDC0826707.1 HAMP domain-containing sensor histidine kinase [Lactococcus petauri]